MLNLSRRLFSTLDREVISQFTRDKIRNFSIIAHIDHGKSTLADRILEMTGTIDKLERQDQHQVLDTLQVERERGITVLAQTASMITKYKNTDYLLNLIDTPGHVDFSYQVNRSLRACQGAVLLVDATSSIQAQTLSNLQKARDANLKIIPVINKIDLDSANVQRALEDLVLQLDFEEEEVIEISAKTGFNCDKLIEKIITELDPPNGDPESPTRAFLFNADYISDRGVKLMVQIIDGEIDLARHRSIYSYHKNKKYDMFEIGLVTPSLAPTGLLRTGQVGYILSNMKSIKDAHIGDTFYLLGDRADIQPFPGYEPPQCMVYSGIYPEDATEYEACEKAINSLLLTDGSVSFQYENSNALGGGFRLGFLGMLHMDIFRQRLKDEHGVNVIITHPSVNYR